MERIQNIESTNILVWYIERHAITSHATQTSHIKLVGWQLNKLSCRNQLKILFHISWE